MTSVGSFEAKTHLPKLLKRVAKGEKIIITRRGEPVAATRALAILHRHAGDPAALASTPDREAVDVCASGRSSADAM